MKPRRPKKIPTVAPDFLEKQKASLKRTHRQVIYFNDQEMKAIDEYCRRLKVKTKSSLLRSAVMEKILEGLDETHPTLF